MISMSRSLGTAALALSLAALGCQTAIVGSGRTGSDDRDVLTFTAVEVGDALEAEVHVTPGQPASVVVTGDDNLLAMVRTRVEGSTLRLEVDSPEGSYLDTRLPLKVLVAAPALDHLTARGAAEMVADGFAALDLTITASGASTVEVRGAAESLHVDVRGASDVRADQLQAEVVDVTVAGASDVVVCATGSLDVLAEGASTVEYTCDPDEVTEETAGSSDVHER